MAFVNLSVGWGRYLKFSIEGKTGEKLALLLLLLNGVHWVMQFIGLNLKIKAFIDLSNVFTN